jgi:hypothetical protein
LWSENPDADAVLPTQIRLDVVHNCIYGFTALYDKSVSMDAVEAAIDERYKKWALADFAKSPLRLWRVESEKLAIQLSTGDKKDEKGFRRGGNKSGHILALWRKVRLRESLKPTAHH